MTEGPATRSPAWPRRLAIASGVVIAAALAALARAAPAADLLDALEGRLADAGAAGPPLFGALYVVLALAFFPGSLLTLAAGALFGPLVGTVTVSIASVATAALAFLVARHLARDAIERRARSSRVLGAVDRAVAEGGWKVVALLRLSPLVPFSFGNYLFGVTGVRLLPYLAASWIAMLPGTFLYVYLGWVGRQGLDAAAGAGTGKGPLEWGLLGAGALATLAVSVLITRRARALLERDGALAGAGEDAAEGSTGPRPAVAVALAVTAAVLATAALVFTLRPELLGPLGEGGR